MFILLAYLPRAEPAWHSRRRRHRDPDRDEAQLVACRAIPADVRREDDAEVSAGFAIDALTGEVVADTIATFGDASGLPSGQKT